MIVRRILLIIFLMLCALETIGIFLVVKQFLAYPRRAQQEEIDVTDKIASLASDTPIQLNQVFNADIVCLFHQDVLAVETLHLLFPGKTSLRDDEYEVTDDDAFHIIAIEDGNPIAKIFDVSLSIDIEDETECCSRNLVVKLQDGGSRRKISVVESESRCIKQQY